MATRATAAANAVVRGSFSTKCPAATPNNGVRKVKAESRVADAGVIDDAGHPRQHRTDAVLVERVAGIAQTRLADVAANRDFDKLRSVGS